MLFSETLKKSNQFKYVYKRGKSIANKHIVMYVNRNNLKINRIGYTVSKKVGNSVIRSRVTRLLKENYRLLEKELMYGYDIVIIARESMKEIDFWQTKKSLKHLLKKQNIINKERLKLEKNINKNN